MHAKNVDAKRDCLDGKSGFSVSIHLFGFIYYFRIHIYFYGLSISCAVFICEILFDPLLCAAIKFMQFLWFHHCKWVWSHHSFGWWPKTIYWRFHINRNWFRVPAIYSVVFIKFNDANSYYSSKHNFLGWSRPNDKVIFISEWKITLNWASICAKDVLFFWVSSSSFCPLNICE